MSFPPSEYALREAVRNPRLAEVLPDYIRERRWFGGKTRTIQRAEIAEAVPLPANSPLAYVCFVLLKYDDGREDIYMLPLAFANGAEAAELRKRIPHAVVANTDDLTGDGALYDAVFDPAFCALLLGMIERGETFAGSESTITGEPTTAFSHLRGAGDLEPHVSKAEQSNTSIIYGDKLILKLFRRIVSGENPDLEIGRYLTEQGQFSQIAPVAGSLRYEHGGAEASTLGMLLGFVPNVGDAWDYTLTLLRELRGEIETDDVAQSAQRNAKEEGKETFAIFASSWFKNSPAGTKTLEAARQLGRRTAEMHRALAEATEDPAFAPEPFGVHQAESEVQAMNALADRVFSEARQRVGQQPEAVRADIQRILDSEAQIRERFGALTRGELTARRARAHGDYHLGQVLATKDGDFVIIDFEGEPARTLEERRAKRSALRDVAGMLRSFNNAAAMALTGEDMQPWARAWGVVVSEAFLESYRDVAQAGDFLPDNQAEFDALLDAYLIEKAVYELQYELNNRPDWVRIPAQGILRLVEKH